MRAIWSVHHTVPFIRMMARANWKEGCADKTYALAKIVAGRFDAQLRAYARAAAATRIPLMIEFGHGGERQLVPVERRLQRRRRRRPGALPRRVRRTSSTSSGRRAHSTSRGCCTSTRRAQPSADGTVSPRITPAPRTSTGSASLRTARKQPGDAWDSFASVFAPAYRELAAAVPAKPIALLEFGAIEEAGHDKAAWIAAALRDIASGRYPRLKAESYWSSNWTNDGGGPSIMRIDSSPAVLAAYRAGIRTSKFVSKPVVSSGR